MTTLTFDLAPDELAAFMQDAEDQLAVLGESVVRLEAERGDPALLQAIFRAAHTLKGGAGLIQHARMASLTHALETVLDRLRRGEMAVSADLVDALLASVDMLSALKDEVATGQESGVDVEAAVAWLQRLEAPAPAPEEAWRVQVTVDASSIAPAARLFQALQALREHGEVLSCDPSTAEVEAGAAGTTLAATLRGVESPEGLRTALEEISEVAAVTIAPASEASAPPQAEGDAPAPPAGTRAGGAASPASAAGALTLENRVRIGVEQLDRLMNLTGELVVGRTHLMQIEGELRHTGGEASAAGLGEVALQLSRIIDQLAEEVMRARLVPVASLFVKFPRLVRDVTRALGKEAEFVIQGQDTELDRSVIEAIGDPLIHLLRNAADHGLEPPEERHRLGKPPVGRITLAAQQREGHILITVSDDGRGIAPARVRRAAVEKGLLAEEAAAALTDDEAIELIFHPGMSTAQEVTDLSGRGVGMDIVRANIERLNGSIDVRSVLGEGTTFALTLPLTMAIVPSMLVIVGEGAYAVPLSAVVDVQDLRPASLQGIAGREAMLLRDHVLPVVWLADLFGVPRGARGAGKMVVVRWGRLEAGLVVDGLVGNQEVVIKPLGPLLSGVQGLAGGSILGNGSIALVLDVPALFRLAARQRGEVLGGRP